MCRFPHTALLALILIGCPVCLRAQEVAPKVDPAKPKPKPPSVKPGPEGQNGSLKPKKTGPDQAKPKGLDQHNTLSDAERRKKLSGYEGNKKTEEKPEHHDPDPPCNKYPVSSKARKDCEAKLKQSNPTP